MALNRFMHPRNLYKNKKPNFQELALKYPDFRKFVFPDVTGKLFLDFKHPESLRQLSLTLLQDDFNLRLELPLDRLVPTVPLRLNYIHWLEDVLAGSRTGKLVKGIDIGTGSSCIYPLLSCKLHKDWTFLASELDDQNFLYTQRNIEFNAMQERITVKKASADEDSVLCDLLQDEPDMFDFCMCNPPFFADHVEAQAVAKSRNYSRADPKSVCTASFTESIVEGGEVKFVKRMITDSLKLGTKIRIYSSMVGKKSSLPPLKEELRRLEVPKFSTTEFCQGKTMRWGLAWTFDKTVNFPKSLFQESRKERPPLMYHVPRAVDDLDYNVTNITTRIRALLTELKIQYDITLNQKSLVTMSLVAKENTWLNQRRKRRHKQQKTEEQKECAAAVENLEEKTEGEPGDDSRQEQSQCEEQDQSQCEELNAPLETSPCGVQKIKQQNVAHKYEEISCTVKIKEKQIPCEDKTNPKLDASNMKAESEDNKESIALNSNSTQSQCTDNTITTTDSALPSPSSSVTDNDGKRKVPKSDQKPEIIDKTSEPAAKRQMLKLETGDSDQKHEFIDKTSEPAAKRHMLKLEKRKSDQKPEFIDKTSKPAAERQMLKLESGDDVVMDPVINVNSELPTSSTKDTQSTMHDKKSAEEIVNGYSELFGESAEEKKVFLKCLLKVKLSSPHVVMEMKWVEGENRESLHQVLQYFKNKLSPAVTPVLK